MDPGAFCRAVESYLCRKNDGHLIRIVGPAFELVCGWASAGIPLRIVERGIDRTYGRYYARRPKRRPVRIEYCEADVRDLFDEWRRAVGVGAHGPSAPDTAGEPRRTGAGPRRPAGAQSGRRSLAAHLDDLAARLSAWRPRPGASGIERIMVEARAAIDAARGGAKTLRGDARRLVVEQLADLDRRLPAVARAAVGDAEMRRFRAEAARSLEPFRERMPAAAFAAALEAATDRLLADHFALPRLSFD